ncbi:cold-inducible protein YdjO-related protein [Paenibacillus cremeus]|uniref:cold-inducible protein YdjO-related protein n=1 Tax=Paenibacillus cremeus TaxID=2163881 RepID=UPI0028F6D472|nr:cold-inducible protein YdjO-related protein [Paenibacillus cremeus]
MKPFKKPAVEEAETDVWQCSSSSCNSWIRANFTFNDEPACPLCGSATTKGTKMLPVIVNQAKELRQTENNWRKSHRNIL